jgi:hypothetical protein
MSTNYTPRRRITNRSAIYILALVALLAWCALLLFTHFVPPTSIAAYVTFFVLLAVALTSTLSPLAYVIGLRFISSRLYRATMRHSLRQGALLSLWIVSLGIVMVIEVLALARK